ncbi:hypothetical protein GPDM_16366 [Planococcus donghaensis MPA1U2]|uniref:Uncharacterized protein n=1 Tax=Planococcus donghaensis MPA1U2 TaxID=933115 RepID=E7RL98_9BACL|nr:hypothetical protein GPDM_16366 [Planococcus donghaensis MPA1U2]
MCSAQTVDKLDLFEWSTVFLWESIAPVALGMALARSQEDHLSSRFAYPVDAPSLVFGSLLKDSPITSFGYDYPLTY